jgi:hypothetical protein
VFFLCSEDGKCQLEPQVQVSGMFFHRIQEGESDWVFFLRTKESESQHNPLVRFPYFAKDVSNYVPKSILQCFKLRTKSNFFAN